jgi:hypothetical protein
VPSAPPPKHRLFELAAQQTSQENFDPAGRKTLTPWIPAISFQATSPQQ